MSDVAALENLVLKNKQLKSEIGKVIIGQEQVVDRLLLSIYAGGIVC